ncbi:alpha/beta fold hydrolase [Mesorhizobium sp. L-8-3]|uniref:alpha/beta fold hydrolase n=1 Tax=Mesorhizobium sp. L-8-3 TaxID=2744522 RepID=UPI001925B76B|nr:alpha/beta fold hydrolase [Mesorhizobium sp. L-8-3]BCH21488.1 3-oxoadipate enol-lactonase [Mesorhizobium sp. L-8-3]
MFTHTNAHVLHTIVAGDRSNPPVVLLHSLGTSAALWEAQAEILAYDHFVIRPEFRGHGLSEESRDTLTIELLADDVVAILNGMGVENFALAGVSIGGMVAQVVAANAAGRVRALAIFDSSIASLDPAMWRNRAAKIRADGLSSITEAVLSRWITDEARGTPAAAGLRRMLELTTDEGYAAGCDALAVADCRAATSALELPTVVAVGSEDTATPPAAARVLAEAIPGARLRMIEGAAHLPMFERSDAVTDVLREAFA